MGLSYYPEKAIITDKPKVYFCCCEADHDRMFSHHAELILHAWEDAVIWHSDASRTERRGSDEYMLKLGEMQLFVLPVTAGVMEKDADVTRELDLAVRHGIPILPLMQDGIDARDFARIFPGIHCLNEYKNDISAVSFPEKLGSFLAQVLSGNEEVKKIHSFIRKSLFISYRKKDRASAIAVMKKIHEYDALWDVGFWYDEFLVPGENYHEGIEKALKNCCADVMVITPNTVEPGNYIIKTEYPRARELGCTVVAVEVEKAPPEELKKAYDGLPEMIAVDDRKLGETLESIVQIGSEENGREAPERLYHIGLAYFKGVGMERDLRKGLLLIKRSAEAGYDPAFERLVQIFAGGIAVRADQRCALSWQMAYLRHLEEGLGDTPSPERITRYFDEVFRVADICIDLLSAENAPIIVSAGGKENPKATEEKRKHDKEILLTAERVLAGAVRKIDLLADRKETYTEYLARFAETEGAILRADFDDSAYDDYKNAIVLRERLDDRSESGRMKLAQDCFQLGQMHLSDAYMKRMAGKEPDGKSAEEARFYLSKALLQMENILRENDRADVKRVKVNLNLDLATVYEMLDADASGDGGKRAESLVREAVEMQKIIRIQTDSAEDINLMGTACYHMASFPWNDTETRVHDLEQAVACYSELYRRTKRFAHQASLRMAEGALERLRRDIRSRRGTQE